MWKPRISKKNLCKCSTLFCTFIWRYFARQQRETSQLHILHRKCRMCSPKLLLLVSLFAFFSLPLIFTLLAASISHFLTANFHVFLPTKFKISQTRFCCCFFSLRSPGGHAISRQKNSCCICVAIPVDWVISHWYACGADGARTVTWLPNFLGCIDNQISLLIVLRCALDCSQSPIFP